MEYQRATWRILIAKGTYVEVSIQGLESERHSCEAKDVERAGAILKDVGRVMGRIAERWDFTQKERKEQP